MDEDIDYDALETDARKLKEEVISNPRITSVF